MDNNKNLELISEEKTKKKKFADQPFFFVAFFILIIITASSCGAFFGFLAGSSAPTIREKFSWLNFNKNINPRDKELVHKQTVIQEDSAVIETVKKTSPAVVSIIISKDVSKIQTFRGVPDFFGFDFFNQNELYYNENEEKQKQTVGGGTGFFITTDGMIVTNKHVVSESGAEYTVITQDEKEYSAKVLARDPINDIAIIKIEGTDFPVLELGDSDKVQIGQTVIAIGNSLGEFSNTVSRGIISGLKRNIVAGNNWGQSEKLTDILQTDAAINSGNSGGPLLNINGEVIGINVAIAQSAQNIGFAIPSNQVKKAVEQVKSTGKIVTPFLGVRYIVIDDDLQKENNLPYNYGNLILRGDRMTDFAVIPGSPADKAGLMENDIILEINGQKIDTNVSLSNIIARYNIGDVITLKVWHKGELKEVKVKLEERK